ncbi:hypothetical protein HRR80_000577 [Exophiala dermatitidis]|uniref:CENP-V/GFA domain-containing protein n=1 Tax=Exophiala dermatitidis TaxID=5970 RepID=A0AAN6F346_EXODE|nr:hypothetical protein HRR80_000577 [Exophiala dermatitidis]
MEGECLCKAVKVKVNDDNLFGTQRRGHLCHCANCRKVAGGIFGANLTIEEEKVEFPNGKGNIKMYSDPETLSGTPVQRYFCQTCGVPIMSITPLYKGKIILKLGIVSVTFSLRDYAAGSKQSAIPLQTCFHAQSISGQMDARPTSLPLSKHLCRTNFCCFPS